MSQNRTKSCLWQSAARNIVAGRGEGRNISFWVAGLERDHRVNRHLRHQLSQDDSQGIAWLAVCSLLSLYDDERDRLMAGKHFTRRFKF
jgi:hypothetical protein